MIGMASLFDSPILAIMSGNDLTNHVERSSSAWTCLPLPDSIPEIPEAPFKGLPISTLVAAPPQLIAHIIRMQASPGSAVQVLTPKAVPMLATIERVDPYRREADNIVVTTQASSTIKWPTSDGRSLDHLFPGAPIKSDGADAPLVTRTMTRPLGKTTALDKGSNPISKAIVKAAAIIDVQRRDDVSGDADCFAEVLDTAWGLPRGTFGTVAPLVVAGSQDLLRTAISSDHNAPDCISPVHLKRCIHVDGGAVTRTVYGEHTSMDWARQRAVARSIFCQSMAMEGIDYFPTLRTYAAKDVTAPIHSSQREKHLVFQPCYASGYRIDPPSFCFKMPPDPPGRFALCDGMTGSRGIVTVEDLDFAMADMVASGLPLEAANLVRETFENNRIKVLVFGTGARPRANIRATDASSFVAPSRGALIIAAKNVESHIMTNLSRGAQPARVLRSRIFDLMHCSDAATNIPSLLLLKTLKEEKDIFNLPHTPYALLKVIASRMSHSLGTSIVQSLAIEADRVGSSLEEWFSVAVGVVPKKIRPEVADAQGWSLIAVWGMWCNVTAKWEGALNSARHRHLEALANAEAAARYVSITFSGHTYEEETARSAITSCKSLYIPYYSRMYDYYCLVAKHSKTIMPIGVGGVVMPAVVSEEKRKTSVAMYLGAMLWRLRAAYLDTMHFKEVARDTPLDQSTVGVILHAGKTFWVCVAPNRAYENMRHAYDKVRDHERDPTLPAMNVGHIAETVAAFPKPLFAYMDDWEYSEASTSRLARYVMDPPRFKVDVERTTRLAVNDIQRALVAVAAALPRADVASPTAASARAGDRAEPLPPIAAPKKVSPEAAVTKPAVKLEPAAVVANVPRFSAMMAARRTGVSGWLAMKKLMGDMAEDTVMCLRETRTEEEVDALMTGSYEDTEAFRLALDALTEPIDNDAVVLSSEGGTAALNV